MTIDHPDTAPLILRRSRCAYIVPGQLRREAYNLANHPQLDEPQRNLTSPAFGKITNTLNDGRLLQFGLRLVL